MFKITNIQATRTIGAVLILLSGNAFAGTPKPPPLPSYATQTALNAEVTARANADKAEVTRRNAAIRVETTRAMAAEAAGAGTTIADGTHKGDILEWDGFAWAPLAAEPVYILGDIRPDGGVVYYVDGSGHHGLAAQPNDEASAMNWSDAMAAAQAHNNPSCPTDILKTPTCWHLPTKTELNYLFEQKSFVGGFANSNYWSSTVYDSTSAWSQLFTNGLQGLTSKHGPTLRVRAVQAF